MELLPRPIHFDHAWRRIRDVVETLLAGAEVNRTDWNERFFDIYHLCVSSPDKPMGPVLHHEVKAFISSRVDEFHRQLILIEDTNERLSEFFRLWQNFSSAVNQLNLLFVYLNLNVVEKQKYSEVNIDYAQYGIGYEDHLFEVVELAFDIWERQMVRTQAGFLIQALLSEIKRDRMGFDVDTVVVKGIISSFVTLLKFKPRNQLRLYEEMFEVPFFHASRAFFIEESRTLLETCDCSKFMKRIQLRLISENALIHCYLNPSSFRKMALQCTDRLLSDNVAYINSHCREMLSNEKWHDLGVMYELLSSIENGLEVMVSELESHLQQCGLRLMKSLSGGGDMSTQFVESTLSFYGRYQDQIQKVFAKNSRFLSALDKACTVAVNYRPTPKAVCKSPELLARYCDKLLRRGSKSSVEAELDDCFTQVMILFNYIDDKDVFQRFYSRFLAKRLIFHLSLSSEAEEGVINRLRQACGYDYTRKLHRMFTDMTISSDLNNKFNEYLQDNATRTLSHGYAVQVLQADAWPVSHSNLPAFSFPRELEKFIHEFEQFYRTQYSGRKLVWMYNLSLVELKFQYLARPYVVTMEMYLMTVLLQFNTSEAMTYQELSDACQIPSNELLQQIQLLINAKILIMEGSEVEMSVLWLNTGYTNRRTKFKVLPLSQADTSHVREEVQMLNGIKDDRRIFIEASIVRTMKARRELKHSALVEEVINQSKSRFVPRVPLIKKCIELLVERQYIGRAENSSNVYVYIV